MLENKFLLTVVKFLLPSKTFFAKAQITRTRRMQFAQINITDTVHFYKNFRCTLINEYQIVLENSYLCEKIVNLRELHQPIEEIERG